MNHKLVVFDLDGTIIDETIFIWKTIHESLGTDEENKKYMEAYYNKEISYEEWAKADIQMWKKAGADKKIITKIIEPLKLMKGTLETLKKLKNNGLKLAIISGSLNIALEHVLPNYKEFFDDVLINNIIFNENGTIKDLVVTKYDDEHKATGLKMICKKEGIDPKECVFVGDNHNDIHIAELAGKSIAFNCKSDSLAEIANVVIEKKDLREILVHII